MPFFKSLTSFPQQFAMNGSVYLINPGEIVELPEDFVGRYAGLIDQVHPIFVQKPVQPVVREVHDVVVPEIIVVDEEVVSVIDDSELDVVDDIESAVKNANVFISREAIVSTEQEVVKEEVLVKVSKAALRKAKFSKKGK